MKMIKPIKPTKILIISFLFSLLGFFLHAQPVMSSKTEIAGLTFYRDYQDERLYYFEPGPLSLLRDNQGQADLSLAMMRYTGTACTDDQGEKSYLNILNFTLQMEAPDLGRIKRAKALLSRQGKEVEIMPIPIRYLKTYVLLPMKSYYAHKRVLSEGVGEEIDEEDGRLWERKSFTFRLSNTEAQLFLDQIKNERTKISVGYGFYADAVPGDQAEMQVSGDVESLKEIKQLNDWEQVLEEDTPLASRLVYSNTFSLDIDGEEIEDLITQLDINQGLPPVYPALEVRCYDFKENLRSDLALKRVEIKATGVGGKSIDPINFQFRHRSPEIYAKNLHFPFAIRMDDKISYRVSTVALDGSRNEGEWKEQLLCEGPLDITTPAEENPVQRYEVAFEADKQVMKDDGVSSIQVMIAYTLNGEKHNQKLVLDPGENLMYNEYSFGADRGEKALYQLAWIKDDGEVIYSAEKELDADYVFVSTPD